MRTQLFSVPAVMLHAALSGGSARAIVRPGNIVTLCAKLFNALVSYPLVLGRWGVPGLGIRGAAISIGLTRVLMLLVLLGLVLSLRLHRDAWCRGVARVLDRAAILRQLTLGLPNRPLESGSSLWAFQARHVIAGASGTWRSARTLSH